MKETVIDYLKRLFYLLLGLFITAIGVVLMRRANIGLDPWSVLSQGIELTFHISYGLATNLASFAIMFFAILLGEGIGLGTIANCTIFGVYVDLILKIGYIKEANSILSSVILMILGIILAALGTWLYMESKLGQGPRDSFMVGLVKKTKLPVFLCRMTVDVLATLCGYLLGGKVGLGTVMAASLLGPSINLFFKLFKYDAKVVHQENILETIKSFRKE